MSWKKLELQTLDPRQRADAFLHAWSPSARRLIVRLGTYPDVGLAILDREVGQIGPARTDTHPQARFIDDDTVALTSGGTLYRFAARDLAMLANHALTVPRDPSSLAVSKAGARCAILTSLRGRGRVETLDVDKGASTIEDGAPVGRMAALVYDRDEAGLRAIGAATEPLGPLVEWRSGRGLTALTKEAPFAAALSGDGSTIALVERATGGALLRVLDEMNRTRVTMSLPGESSVKLSLSTDGSRFALTHEETGTLQVFDALRGGPAIFSYSLRGDERHTVSQAHLSPDGETVLWARRTLAEWRVARI